MRATVLVPALLLALASAAGAQQRKHPGVDQRAVDAAIQKGITWLHNQDGPAHHLGAPDHSNELLLYTYINAGVPEEDPKFQKYLQAMLTEPLTKTYKVSLQAMVLEEIDRVRHQARIWQCAQFLVDNQIKNGMWSYGEPTEAVKNAPNIATPSASVPSVPSSDGGVVDFGGPRRKPARSSRSSGKKPRVVNRVAVTQTREGGGGGDFSNTQYAALGLRACHDSGIILPREIIVRARDAWRNAIKEINPADGPYGGRGWCYGSNHSGHTAYGSMTAGGAGSLAIYSHLLGEKPKSDPYIGAAIQWLVSHWSVKENPGPSPEDWMKSPAVMHYYFLYALERAGVLVDMTKMGRHDWYREGANFLIDDQKPDGHWQGGAGNQWDTCFAILFLRRATAPLIDTPSLDATR